MTAQPPTRMLWIYCALVIAAGAVATVSGASTPPADTYRVSRALPLPGDSGWDYIALDPDTHRLFITRDNHVMVLDAASGAVVGDIGGLQHVHGVAFAGPHGYITDGGADAVIVFDRHSLHQTGRIAAGNGPDGILYDAASGRIFAFNGRGHSITAIDTASGRVAGTVPLGGAPEAAAVDGHGRLFVNLEDRSQIVELATQTLQVTRRWPLAPCADPSGMAIDAAHERIFSGCRNSLLAVSNARTGKLIATVPIGEGVDSNRFDPTDGLVFSSNGRSATLTVIRELDANHYSVLQNLPTAAGARTMELDPATHRVYLVAADLKFPASAPRPPPPPPSGASPVANPGPANPGPPAAPAPAGAPPRPFQRPSVVPGTFRLLILDR